MIAWILSFFFCASFGILSRMKTFMSKSKRQRPNEYAFADHTVRKDDEECSLESMIFMIARNPTPEINLDKLCIKLADEPLYSDVDIPFLIPSVDVDEDCNDKNVVVTPLRLWKLMGCETKPNVKEHMRKARRITGRKSHDDIMKKRSPTGKRKWL